MKRLIINRTERIIGMMVFLIGFSFSVVAEGNLSSSVKADKDTTSFFTLNGKVLDKDSNRPIVFATINIIGTNIGTVTNADGEFVIKVPKERQNNSLGVNHIGYQNYKVSLDGLRSDNLEIPLQSLTIPINEVVITNLDPMVLLKSVIRRIPENYSTDPAMYTSFYRETIKQNRHYVSVSEAVLNAYKAPYNSLIENDRVKVHKGRKSQDVKRMDTVLFKLQGGPFTAFLLDVVKNPDVLLSEEILPYYDYHMAGQIAYNDRNCYVVEFDQKPSVMYPLYQGRIYIDMSDLAVVGIEFNLSPTGLQEAGNLLVRKKPASMTVETLGANYLVNYSERDGKWFLNYVRAELNFRSKWQRRLFFSNYTVMTEMAITDIDKENINKYRVRETTRLTDILADEVGVFDEDDYWGEYNYIKPDESIQTAIEKLSRRLRRSQ